MNVRFQEITVELDRVTKDDLVELLDLDPMVLKFREIRPVLRADNDEEVGFLFNCIVILEPYLLKEFDRSVKLLLEKFTAK